MLQLQLPKRHVLDHVTLTLLQDEVGTLPRRQDVLVQVDEIDAVPNRRRGGDRLVVVLLERALQDWSRYSGFMRTVSNSPLMVSSPAVVAGYGCFR